MTEEIDHLRMAVKYLQLRAFLHQDFNYILHELLHSEGLEKLANMCEVDLIIGPCKKVSHYYYQQCCDGDAHVVLMLDKGNNFDIFLGSLFWQATNIHQHTKVYLFFYVLHQVHKYFCDYGCGFYDDDLFQYVLDQHLMPYLKPSKYDKPRDSFETFYKSNEEFPIQLTFVKDKKNKTS